ncbi:MAG: envelope integrity protein Cei [Pseudonocardia sp.]
MADATARPRRTYRRRRQSPVLIVVTVLAMATVVTWTTVLVNASGPAGPASCPAPTQGPSPGESLESDALDEVAPLPPSAVRVRVLNASGQRGQANLVAAQFGDLGFVEEAPPDNDPFYPEGNMECAGQVRFGPAGESAASTLTLVLPCAELVRDGRTDDTVDVSVGTGFGDANPDRAARDALDQLAAPAGGTDGAGNADPVGTDGAPAPAPAVDPAVLAAARNTSC